MKDTIILCNVTIDQPNPNHEMVESFLSSFAFERFIFQQLTFDEYKKCVDDMGLGNPKNSIIKVLYRITNQNLEITKKALSYPESYLIEGVQAESNGKDFLKVLIEKRLSALGATHCIHMIILPDLNIY